MDHSVRIAAPYGIPPNGGLLQYFDIPQSKPFSWALLRQGHIESGTEFITRSTKTTTETTTESFAAAFNDALHVISETVYRNKKPAPKEGTPNIRVTPTVASPPSRTILDDSEFVVEGSGVCTTFNSKDPMLWYGLVVAALLWFFGWCTVNAYAEILTETFTSINAAFGPYLERRGALHLKSATSFLDALIPHMYLCVGTLFVVSFAILVFIQMNQQNGIISKANIFRRTLQQQIMAALRDVDAFHQHAANINKFKDNIVATIEQNHNVLGTRYTSFEEENLRRIHALQEQTEFIAEAVDTTKQGHIGLSKSYAEFEQDSRGRLHTIQEQADRTVRTISMLEQKYNMLDQRFTTFEDKSCERIHVLQQQADSTDEIVAAIKQDHIALNNSCVSFKQENRGEMHMLQQRADGAEKAVTKIKHDQTAFKKSYSSFRKENCEQIELLEERLNNVEIIRLALLEKQLNDVEKIVDDYILDIRAVHQDLGNVRKLVGEVDTESIAVRTKFQRNQVLLNELVESARDAFGKLVNRVIENDSNFKNAIAETKDEIAKVSEKTKNCVARVADLDDKVEKNIDRYLALKAKMANKYDLSIAQADIAALRENKTEKHDIEIVQTDIATLKDCLHLTLDLHVMLEDDVLKLDQLIVDAAKQIADQLTVLEERTSHKPDPDEATALKPGPLRTKRHKRVKDMLDGLLQDNLRERQRSVAQCASTEAVAAQEREEELIQYSHFAF